MNVSCENQMELNVKRTSKLEMELNTDTKRRFYKAMHMLGKRKQNTLIYLLNLFDSLQIDKRPK